MFKYSSDFPHSGVNLAGSCSFLPRNRKNAMWGVGQGQLIDRGHRGDLFVKIFRVCGIKPGSIFKKHNGSRVRAPRGAGGAGKFSEMRAGEKKKVVGFLLSDQYSPAGGVKSVVHRAIPLLTRSSST